MELVAARQLFGLRLGLVERLEKVEERTARHGQRSSVRGRQEPASARRGCTRGRQRRDWAFSQEPTSWQMMQISFSRGTFFFSSPFVPVLPLFFAPVSEDLPPALLSPALSEGLLSSSFAVFPFPSPVFLRPTAASCTRSRTPRFTVWGVPEDAPPALRAECASCAIFFRSPLVTPLLLLFSFFFGMVSSRRGCRRGHQGESNATLPPSRDSARVSRPVRSTCSPPALRVLRGPPCTSSTKVQVDFKVCYPDAPEVRLRAPFERSTYPVPVHFTLNQ